MASIYDEVGDSIRNQSEEVPPTGDQSTPQPPEESATPEGSTEPAEQYRQRGVVTELGEGIDYVLDGGLGADALNAVAAGANKLTGGRLQGLDDFFMGYDEQQERMAEIYKDQQAKRKAGEYNNFEAGLDTVKNTLTGVSEGMAAGINMPATVLARVTNQDSPWSRTPEILRGKPFGEAAFAISEVVTATALTQGVASGYGVLDRIAKFTGLGAGAIGGVALVGESAIETATQEKAEDIIAGQWLADRIGEVSDWIYPGTGAELAAELKQGVTPKSQAYVAAVGFLQNLGINYGVPQAIKYFRDDEYAEQVAKINGKSKDEVLDSIADETPATQTGFDEIHEAANNIDTGVSRPTLGNQIINNDSLIREAIRNSENNADIAFFTNLDAITPNTAYQQIIDEATGALKKLGPFTQDMVTAIKKAKTFFEENTTQFNGIDWFDDDSVYRQVIGEFAEKFTTFTNKDLEMATKQFVPEKIVDFEGRRFRDFSEISDIDLHEYLLERSAVTPEGMIAAMLLSDELGVRLQRQAAVINTLDENSVDFTEAVKKYIRLQDKGSLIFMPWRRGKRQFALSGNLQQREQILNALTPEGADAAKRDLGVETKSSEFAKLSLTKEGGDPLFTLWEKAQKGDTDALKTMKLFFNAVEHSDPGSVNSISNNLLETSADQLRKGNVNARRTLYYSYLISRIAPVTSSLAGNVANLLIEPLGNIGKFNVPDVAYGVGQIVGGITSLNAGFKASAKAFKDGATNIKGNRLDLNLENLQQQREQLKTTWEGVQKSWEIEKVPMMERGILYGNFLQQRLALNPLMSQAFRALTAVDQMTQTAYGMATATGRAYKRAFQQPLGGQTLSKMLAEEQSRVFKDGITSGEIIDPEVIKAGKQITLQAPIPKDG